MRFVQGTFDDDESFERLRGTIEELDKAQGTGGNFAFYLSVPPRSFPVVIQQLKKHGLADQTGGSWRRAVIEKPFGHDLKSAEELNAIVHEVFAPDQVFRIDHYLGKETVQNILALRFANTMFEPIWNRSFVDHVQITMAEDIGIGGRAGYYDGIGAARDVIQNHLLQLLALTAMEEPASFDADALAAEKTKVLGAVRLPKDLGRDTVRAQYAAGWQGGAKVIGYLEEEGIDPSSKTDTYAAIKVGIDNRRWAGVLLSAHRQAAGPPGDGDRGGLPAGAALPFDTTATEELGQNAIVIRVQPDEGVTVRFGSKVPGTSMEIRDVSMDFAYGESFTESSPEAYERLILDVLLGDSNLFPRTEEVELSWKILDPIEEYWDAHGRPARYQAARGDPSRRTKCSSETDGAGAAMKTDLTDTTASKINKALVKARRAIGTPAVGMVLTLVIVTDEENAYDALKAAATPRASTLAHPGRHQARLPLPARPDAVAAGRRGAGRRGRGHRRDGGAAAVRRGRRPRPVGGAAAAAPRRPGRGVVAGERAAGPGERPAGRAGPAPGDRHLRVRAAGEGAGRPRRRLHPGRHGPVVDPHHAVAFDAGRRAGPGRLPGAGRRGGGRGVQPELRAAGDVARGPAGRARAAHPFRGPGSHGGPDGHRLRPDRAGPRRRFAGDAGHPGPAEAGGGAQAPGHRGADRGGAAPARPRRHLRVGPALRRGAAEAGDGGDAPTKENGTPGHARPSPLPSSRLRKVPRPRRRRRHR